MSPTSSYSTTSTSSNGDTITDIKHQMEPNLSRDELTHMQNFHSYRYYPDALYDGTPVPMKMESPISVSLPGVASLERGDSKIAIAEDYPSATLGRLWGHGAYNSYMGTDTSRGWYPELQSSAAMY